MRFASRAAAIYELGEKYSITSTIINDFVPDSAQGPYIRGTLVNSGETGWFLDLACGFACNVLGYNHPAIKNAILSQLNTGLWQFPSCDWHSEPAVMLKKKLCEIAPVPETKKAFLCNSGTEAVEAAIKACQARRYREKTVRPTFWAFKGSFNGRTLGSLSFNASKKVHTEGFGTALTTFHFPFPEKNNPESIKYFEGSLQNYCKLGSLDMVNAVFLELVQGEGGINVIDETALEFLFDICRRNDIYIVVDEVQTGMMRTGRMFACEHYDLQPDIICLGKALGGGLPMGAIVANETFDFKPSQHSNTFGGNQIASAAALAVIDELEKLDKVRLNIKVEMLRGVAEEGLGMMRRIKFDSATSRNSVIKRALNANIIVIGAGETAVRLMPPVNIPIETLRNALNSLHFILRLRQ